MILWMDDKNKYTLSRHEKTGKVIKLAPGIYSNDIETDPKLQVRVNLLKILARMRPGAVISHKSALQHDFGASGNKIFITDHSISRTYAQKLQDIDVIATPGPAPLSSDTNADGIYIASKGRAILECLGSTRSGSITSDRILGRDALKKILGTFLSSSGSATGMLALLAQVNKESNRYWSSEIEEATALINELKPDSISATYDHKRVELFEELALSLSRGIYGNEALWDDADTAFTRSKDYGSDNLAFFVSYFSNFIEGTEFPAEEALEIVQSVNPHHMRPKDGHDIKALYGLYAEKTEIGKLDGSADEFITNLRHWHHRFMDHPLKAEMLPGQFKDRANRAGNTWFTEPHLVESTLRKSWEIGRSLKNTADLAIYRALSTVVIHPFMDGNGRITRMAAANVLARDGKPYFMIPTVFREDYILAMQAFSAGDPVPAIRAFKRAMDITLQVPWNMDWKDVNLFLSGKNAFSDPREAKWGGLPPQKPESSGFRF